MKSVALIASLVTLVAFSAPAQVQTLATGITGSATNSAILTVPTNYYAAIQSAKADYGGTLLLNVQGVPFSYDLGYNIVTNLMFTGPATIQVQGSIYGPAMVTVNVEPIPAPTGNALSVPTNSGTIQVTMETSTDLFHWTTAVNGQLYTNLSDPQFFRITLLNNP